MRKFISLCLTFIIALGLISCGSSGVDSAYKIYYLKSDKAGIISVDYEFKSSKTAEMVEEALSMLAAQPDNIDYINTIPSGVQVKSWDTNDGSMNLYLVGDYEALDIYTEILVRAAIVKTLVQIKGVDSVSIYINDSPLTDSKGEAIGAMTADTFIEDFGQETDSLLSTELTLYFASADGMSTVAEKRQVYYSRNVGIEKLVIDQLLKGPDSDSLLSAISTGTKLNSVTVSENGVCIVNFDAAFETTVTNVTENVTIYSIVNSLTELDNVKQVQILVNGDTPHISNVDVDLSSPISRNEDIINTITETDEDQYYDDLDTEDIELQIEDSTGTTETTAE